MPSYKLSKLAEILDAELHGDPDCEIHAAASLASAVKGDLCFLRPDAKHHLKTLQQTQASAVLLNKVHAAQCSNNMLVVANPELAFAKALVLLYPDNKPQAGIAVSAQVAEGAHIDPSVSIGPHCVIEKGVKIGANSVIAAGTVIGENCQIGKECRIYSRVTLYHGVKIGDRAIIHSGVVIGSDGFGLARDGLRWHKIPQVGTVVIGNDVEVGANSTIDRGALEDTVIAEGVKIDNQVQIAHNVKIGAHTAIAGCVGIAGSTEIGSCCMIGGGACINGHIKIADGVIVTGMGAVGQSITESGYYSSGISVTKNSLWRRNMLRFHQLDEMAKRLRKLEQNREKLYNESE